MQKEHKIRARQANVRVATPLEGHAGELFGGGVDDAGVVVAVDDHNLAGGDGGGDFRARRVNIVWLVDGGRGEATSCRRTVLVDA